eukprot:Nitzschia sp. Nitz4//scaffold53_size117307//80403//82130//NITZ4_003777-RA/size117307-processed-gene-0.17-mRNA-1//1//CDS//3329554226//4108//frame0
MNPLSSEGFHQTLMLESNTAMTETMTSPALTLRQEASLRASNGHGHAYSTSTSSQSQPSPFSSPNPWQTPSKHVALQQEATPQTPHPLTLGGGSKPQAQSPSEQTPDYIVESARKDWQRHGPGLTQPLEDKRHSLGTWTVRVISAETRRDASGAKYTTYILSVQLANGDTLELEHRYSEFAKLRQLLKTYQISLPCAFPEKHWAGRLGQWTPSLKWAPSQHEDLVQFRKVQLDVWLVHVVEQYNLGSLPTHVHQAVYTFLTTSDTPPCDQDNNLYLGGDSTADTWTQWNNPLSFTLGSNIRQATSTVEHMFGLRQQASNALLNDSDQSIPLDLLHSAKGLCFMTVLKGGLVVSGRVGTGLLVARIDRNQWSAPCALGTVGMGWGMLAGGDITHYLVVLTTTDAVDAILGGTVQLGAELGVAVGPVGRGATSQVASSGSWAVHPAYSYAHSQGLFMGMSLEGSVLTVRSDVNAKFYGQHFSPTQILDMPPPKAALPLYQVLSKAMALPIPEDAFRPSQMFQDKYAKGRPTRNMNAASASPSQPGIDPSGRVMLADSAAVTEPTSTAQSTQQPRQLF